MVKKRPVVKTSRPLKLKIAKLMQIKRALRKGEAFYRALFDATPEAMLLSDEQGIIVLVNQQAEHLLGYRASELIGQSIDILVPERFRAEHNRKHSAYTSAPSVKPLRFGIDLPVLHKDGGQFFIETSLSPIPIGNGLLIASSFRDVTQRKQKEDSLRLSEDRFRRMADASPAMIWMTDVNGHPTFVNKTWLDFTGIGFGQAMNPDGWLQLVHPEDGHSVIRMYCDEKMSDQSILTEYRLRHADGDWRWVLDKGVPLFDELGQFSGYIGSAIDVTERKRAMEALVSKEFFLRTIYENIQAAIFVVDIDPAGLYRYAGWNSAGEAMTGIRSDQAVGLSPEEVFGPVDGKRISDNYTRCAEEGTHVYEECFASERGEVWSLTTLKVRRDDAGRAVQIIGLATDITERRQADIDLRIAAVAFNAQESMIITDAESMILRVNQAFVESSGYTAEELIGQTPRLFKSGHHNADFYRTMWETIRDTGSWQGEIWDRRKNGEVYPKWLTITAVRRDDGVVTHYVGTHLDITERKAQEDEIRHLAFYDPLTLLPNRRLLMDRLRRNLTTCARSRKHGVLLFIDLDNFKVLNDTHGHDMGDLLLRKVANRLTRCVRETDTVARLGGDEFIVMLEELSMVSEEASVQAKIIGKKILATLNQPYHLAGREHRSTPSIGAALFGPYDKSADELLKQADIAMYQSKAAGRNSLHFFDPSMQLAVTERASYEADLFRGLKEKQFALYYQPQMDKEGRLTGAEALVRWLHPVRGIVMPADFIALAEETRLILPLGQWVLETACAQLAAWAYRPETAHLSLAVNISVCQFCEADFVDQVLAIIAHTGANPHRLKLELTENLLASDIEDIIDKMSRLKASGVGFSLDDFGTGYSSLSYLKRLPLDQLKIDRGFVQDILNDANDATITKMIVALAASMGLEVIAEGVENEAQRSFLSDQGCNICQGYLYSYPLPSDVFSEFALRGF